MKKKKKSIWNEVVQKANGGLEGNVKQMWQGISGMGKRAGLAGHYKRLGVPSENEACDQVLKKEVDAWAQEEKEASKADVGNVELEREFTADEIEARVNKLQCHKAAGADGIVNEFMKFGGKGMIQMMVPLYIWVWKNEHAPRRSKEGVVVDLFQKGDQVDRENYRGYTLLNTVGKVFCKLLNDKIVGVLEKEHRVNLAWHDGLYDRLLIISDGQGESSMVKKRRESRRTASFLDVKKAYDTVWRNGLWKQLSKLSANDKKSAVMVCNEDREESVEYRWKWGVKEIAVVDQYTYLGVEIAKDYSWNAHTSKVAEKGKARAGKLHPILANPHLNTRIKLTVLKSVIVPPLEYAGEVWEGNKKVKKELEGAKMKAAKIILGCSKGKSNAAVRAGIQSLPSGRDARKLTWQYRMCGMGEERLPRIVWEANWANNKRGRQPTEWVKVAEDAWKGFEIDEDETLEKAGSTGNLRKETEDKECLEVYGMLTVDNEDDKFRCDCGSERADGAHECQLCEKKREVYVTELGKIEGRYREVFEAWSREEKTAAVMGNRKWFERREVISLG
ncbi:unnamed protein product [Ectocarpus sp. CCAP 1310/34]|nr:unnamed protein product [Ectocarpus sp. CCAP 1310/34]